MNSSGPSRPEDATSPNNEGPPPGAGGPPQDAGGGKSGGAKGLIIGAVVVVALVVLGLAVFVGLGLVGGDADEELVAEAGAETTSEQADARAAECEEALRGSEGVTRVIDCGEGWAVLAREGTDEPYWVTYRDGDWVTVNNDTNYVMTCDDAIAQGMPAWMAARYVSNCMPPGDTRPPANDPGNNPANNPANKAGASVPDSVAPPAGGDATLPPPGRSFAPVNPPDLEMAPMSPPQPHMTAVVPPVVASPRNPVSMAPPVTNLTRIAPVPPSIIGPPPVLNPPTKTPRAPRP